MDVIANRNGNDMGCSCGIPQEFVIPCSHLTAYIRCIKKNITDFIHPVYSVETLRAIYSTHIDPVDCQDLCPDNETLPGNIIK